MPLIDIDVHVPYSPVLARRRADIPVHRRDPVQKVRERSGVAGEREEREGTPEERENARERPRKSTAAKRHGQSEKQHYHRDKRQDALEIECEKQRKAEEFEIPGKKLKHEVISDCSVREEDVFGRKVASEREGTNHRHMRHEIAERRQSEREVPVS